MLTFGCGRKAALYLADFDAAWSGYFVNITCRAYNNEDTDQVVNITGEIKVHTAEQSQYAMLPYDRDDEGRYVYTISEWQTYSVPRNGNIPIVLQISLGPLPHACIELIEVRVNGSTGDEWDTEIEAAEEEIVVDGFDATLTGNRVEIFCRITNNAQMDLAVDIEGYVLYWTSPGAKQQMGDFQSKMVPAGGTVHVEMVFDLSLDPTELYKLAYKFLWGGLMQRTSGEIDIPLG